MDFSVGLFAERHGFGKLNYENEFQPKIPKKSFALQCRAYIRA